jgi:hypothetical protein
MLSSSSFLILWLDPEKANVAWLVNTLAGAIHGHGSQARGSFWQIYLDWQAKRFIACVFRIMLHFSSNGPAFLGGLLLIERFFILQFLQLGE